MCGEETYSTSNVVVAAIPPFAGVTELQLNVMRLGGSLPLQLRELRTLTTLSLVRNTLSGTIPACWCVRAACMRAACMRGVYAVLTPPLAPPQGHQRVVGGVRRAHARL